MSLPIVVINGQEKQQIEGTTLADLRATYPSAFLVEVGTEGPEIRRAAFVLKNDKNID